jgi:hypothetical protein
MQELLLPVQQLWSRVLGLLADPGSNLPAAFVLYGIIALALLIILIVAIMFLIGSPDEDEDIVVPPVPAPDDETYEHFDAEVTAEQAASKPSADSDLVPAESEVEPPAVPTPPRSSSRFLLFAGVSLLVVVAVWGVAGYTTSEPSVCQSCHSTSSQHAKAPTGSDPHSKVSCVACHEGNGAFGRYFGSVPARVLHFADSQFGSRLQDNYGFVGTASCSSCHATALQGVTTNKTRGLKMSHKEPLAASAACLDCHRTKAGVVAAYNAGMGPCLRCHDSKQASAECSTCHDQNTANAARARTTTFTAEQIPELKCGGCHDEKKECDTCHGLRMPHSTEFKAYAHSRAGAVDLWFNGGKGCGLCHTATRRPCTQCHTSLFGRAHGGGGTMARTHQAGSGAGCDTCHQQFAYSRERNFCTDLCHSPAAIAGSPR